MSTSSWRVVERREISTVVGDNSFNENSHFHIGLLFGLITEISDFSDILGDFSPPPYSHQLLK